VGCSADGSAPTLGVLPTLWVAVALTAVSALPVVLSPLLRMRDLPVPTPDDPTPDDPTPDGAVPGDPAPAVVPGAADAERSGVRLRR